MNKSRMLALITQKRGGQLSAGSDIYQYALMHLIFYRIGEQWDVADNRIEAFFAGG